MTERKPPGMSWETWIDAQIRVAREQAPSTTCLGPVNRFRTSVRNRTWFGG